MIRIKIGKDLEGEDINFFLPKEGVCVLLGQTGTGKSSILMKLLVGIGQQRQVIVFSYSDEYDNMIYSNCFSAVPDCLPVEKTRLIDDCRVRVSELDDYTYWKYLVPQSAARFCAALAKNVEMHHDIPEMFFEVVRNSPTTKKGSQEDTMIHEASLISIMTSKDEIMGLLNRTSIDWKELVLSGKNIIINLGLAKEEKRKAQFLVGYILHKIKPYIWKTKPVFGFEEADILLEEDSFSALEIVDYNLKMQKAGMFMFLVAQQKALFPRTVLDNATKFIFGSMNTDDDLPPFLRSLISTIRHIPSKNYREFVFWDKHMNFIKKFLPSDVPCYIRKRW